MSGLFSTHTLVLSGSLLILWMICKTFITDSTGIALVIVAIIVGTLQSLRIKPLHEDRISDNIQRIFKFDENDLKKNIIFHKGGAAHAPENTMEAIKQAARFGIQSVEIDMDFTKDKIGVVIHGPRVDNTTDGTGFVSDFTYEELQYLNAAAKDVNKNKFPDVRIPTLEAVVKECIKEDMVIFIDCKSNPSETAKLVCELYKTFPELYRIGVVCSFYPTIVYAVRNQDPNIVTAVTHRSHILNLNGDGSERNKELWKRVICPFLDPLLAWLHWALVWFICGNSFFLCNKDYVCLDNKSFWSELGIRLVAWTVNDPAEQTYLLRHLHVPIITDGLTQGGPVDPVEVSH